MSMSKVIKSSSKELQTSGESSFMFRSYQQDYIVGRLCTLLESYGLRETQERAAKDIIKQEVYSWFNNTQWVPGPLADVVSTVMYQLEHRPVSTANGRQSTPLSVKIDYEVIATEN